MNFFGKQQEEEVDSDQHNNNNREIKPADNKNILSSAINPNNNNNINNSSPSSSSVTFSTFFMAPNIALRENSLNADFLNSDSMFSPGILSPPVQSSTPSVPLVDQARQFRCTHYYHQYRESPSNLEDNINNVIKDTRKQPVISLTNLDDLAIDRIIGLLSDQDLRAFHQVSRTWKSVIESRNADNQRRLQLVRNIQENKENIRNQSQNESAPAINRVKRDTPSDIKPGSGSLLLIECTNLIPNAVKTSITTEGNILTPTSRFSFQSFEEAEKSLQKGQKLFQCRRCNGPVPSPILHTAEEVVVKGPNQKIEATRCRLISRMGTATPKETEQLWERKKSKTPLSVMPSPICPVDIPTTTTALGERMSKSLVISNNADQMNESGNNSALSLGIDLHLDLSKLSDASSINCKLNFTNASFNRPFSPFSILSFESPICKSSYVNRDEHTDDNYGFNKSIFPNLILSPTTEEIPQSSIFYNSNVIETPQKKDLKKLETLNSLNDSISNNNNSLLALYSMEHDEHSHSKGQEHINDINSMHETSLISSNKENVKETNVLESYSSRNIFHEGPPHSSKSTSDYFSWRSSSVLRDGSKSYFPEMSSGRLELARTFDDSTKNKTKSRSLGNVIDISEVQALSFESNLSTASCPNLNESFILECPNPNCSYRFCSTCLCSEHPGRPCRIIESESFEDLNTSCSNNNVCSVSQRNNKNTKGESQGKCTGKSKHSKSKNKKSLRRIAKL